MANGIPDYNEAIKSKDDAILSAYIKRFAKRMPIVCPCINMVSTAQIEGTEVNYLKMTCSRCKVSEIWLVNKYSGNTAETGSKDYIETINHLKRAVYERHNSKKR